MTEISHKLPTVSAKPAPTNAFESAVTLVVKPLDPAVIADARKREAQAGKLAADGMSRSAPTI